MDFMTFSLMYIDTQVYLTAGRGRCCALYLFGQTRKTRKVTLQRCVARRQCIYVHNTYCRISDPYFRRYPLVGVPISSGNIRFKCSWRFIIPPAMSIFNWTCLARSIQFQLQSCDKWFTSNSCLRPAALRSWAGSNLRVQWEKKKSI